MPAVCTTSVGSCWSNRSLCLICLKPSSFHFKSLFTRTTVLPFSALWTIQVGCMAEMQPGWSVINSQLNLRVVFFQNDLQVLFPLCSPFLQPGILFTMPDSALPYFLPFFPEQYVFSLLFPCLFFLITDTVFGFFQEIDFEYLHGSKYIYKYFKTLSSTAQCFLILVLISIISSKSVL